MTNTLKENRMKKTSAPATESAAVTDAKLAADSATAANESAAEVRRRVPRRVINQKIGLLAAGQYVAHAIALEIGEGGMLIHTDLQLSKGQKIVITVRIRGVMQGVMLTSVVYLLKPKPGEKGHRYGLQFENIDFDIKRKIRNFVASGAGQVAKSAS
jgi:hypothetical protein